MEAGRPADRSDTEGKSDMDITPYLKLMVDKQGSDLFFSTGTTAHVKIQGKMAPIGETPFQVGMVEKMAYALMNEAQAREFEQVLEMNLALSVPNLGRFRVNVFRQRGEVAMVIRYIQSKIPTPEELNLPMVLKDLVMSPRGMVLVVGATGSGKSSTLAAMIGHRNSNSPGHILTIEDPVEFMHEHKKCVVNQREVGLDALTYANALKNALREAPDVILIGEIRDRETMEHANNYAETGHLCLSTLHANNANQAIDRIINFFPENARRQILMDLSLNMRAIISQRLVPSVDGGRVPAVEVLINTAHVAELIRAGEISQLKDAMEKGNTRGMQTFDGALYNLAKMGRITQEEALNYADSRNNLSLRFNLGG